MKTSKLSVLMAVCNGEEFLRNAIDSILKQTFREFEFIIINDGSQDGTGGILRDYRDDRMVIVNHQTNEGLIRSLNAGLRYAKGQYVARMDADDISLPERFVAQVNYLDENPQVGVLGSAVDHIDSQGKILNGYFPPVDHEDLRAYLLIGNCFRHSTLMIRRPLMELIKGYDEFYQAAEDYEMLWRLSCITKIGNLSDSLVQYRIHSGSVTNRRRLQQLKTSCQISFKAVSECLNGESLDQESFERFWWAYYEWFWDEKFGIVPMLGAGDIKRLASFWKLLARFPSGSKMWRTRFLEFAYGLIRRRFFNVGIELLKALRHYLNCRIGWKYVVSNYLRAFIK